MIKTANIYNSVNLSLKFYLQTIAMGYEWRLFQVVTCTRQSNFSHRLSIPEAIKLSD